MVKHQKRHMLYLFGSLAQNKCERYLQVFPCKQALGRLVELPVLRPIKEEFQIITCFSIYLF